MSELKAIGAESGAVAKTTMETFTAKYLENYAMLAVKGYAQAGIAEAQTINAVDTEEDPIEFPQEDDNKSPPEVEILEGGDLKFPIYSVEVYDRKTLKGGDNVEYTAYRVGGIRLHPDNTTLCGGAKRYRSLLALHKELGQTIPQVAAMTFPGKKYFGLDDTFLDTRQEELNVYVKNITKKKDVQNHKKFNQFFKFETDFRQREKMAFASALQATAAAEGVSSKSAVELAEYEDEQSMLSDVVGRIVDKKMDSRVASYVSSLGTGYVGKKSKQWLHSGIAKSVAATVGAMWAAARAAIAAIKAALEKLFSSAGEKISTLFRTIGTHLLPMVQNLFGGKQGEPDEKTSEADVLIAEFSDILMQFQASLFVEDQKDGGGVVDAATVGPSHGVLTNDIMQMYDRMNGQIGEFMEDKFDEVQNVLHYDMGFILGAIQRLPGFGPINDEHNRVCLTASRIFRSITGIIVERLRPIVELVRDHDENENITPAVQKALEDLAPALARDLSLMKIHFPDDLSDESNAIFTPLPQELGGILATNIARFAKQIVMFSKSKAPDFKWLFMQSLTDHMTVVLRDSLRVVIDAVQQGTVQGSCAILMEHLAKFYDKIHGEIAPLMDFMPALIKKHLSPKSFVMYTGKLVVEGLIQNRLNKAATLHAEKFAILRNPDFTPRDFGMPAPVVSEPLEDTGDDDDVKVPEQPDRKEPEENVRDQPVVDNADTGEVDIPDAHVAATEDNANQPDEESATVEDDVPVIPPIEQADSGDVASSVERDVQDVLAAVVDNVENSAKDEQPGATTVDDDEEKDGVNDEPQPGQLEDDGEEKSQDQPDEDAAEPSDVVNQLFGSDDDEEVQVERTLALIKPDAVRDGNADEICERIEDEGFKIIRREDITLTEERAKAFYAEHSERGFYGELVEFMTSGPIVALTLEKEGAILAWRKLMGATNPSEAKEEDPKSLRALYGANVGENATHGSDSAESARRELAFFFEDEE